MQTHAEIFVDLVWFSAIFAKNTIQGNLVGSLNICTNLNFNKYKDAATDKTIQFLMLCFWKSTTINS